MCRWAAASSVSAALRNRGESTSSAGLVVAAAAPVVELAMAGLGLVAEMQYPQLGQHGLASGAEGLDVRAVVVTANGCGLVIVTAIVADMFLLFKIKSGRTCPNTRRIATRAQKLGRRLASFRHRLRFETEERNEFEERKMRETKNRERRRRRMYEKQMVLFRSLDWGRVQCHLLVLCSWYGTAPMEAFPRIARFFWRRAQEWKD